MVGVTGLKREDPGTAEATAREILGHTGTTIASLVGSPADNTLCAAQTHCIAS
jgi:hypothetical protein